MKKVAFICVHNSCRSQIAEALGKHLASDVFESYSAGSEIKNQINPDAVRLMKNLYGIDMEKTQHPKLINEIPQVDMLYQWDVMLVVLLLVKNLMIIGNLMIQREKRIKNL